jgi:hypothetical protein
MHSIQGLLYIYRKGDIIWYAQKLEEKQDENNDTCQIAPHGMSGLWSHDQFPKMVKSNIKELEWKMTVSGKNTDVLEELNPPLQLYPMTVLVLTNNNYRQLTVVYR